MRGPTRLVCPPRPGPVTWLSMFLFPVQTRVWTAARSSSGTTRWAPMTASTPAGETAPRPARQRPHRLAWRPRAPGLLPPCPLCPCVPWTGPGGWRPQCPGELPERWGLVGTPLWGAQGCVPRRRPAWPCLGGQCRCDRGRRLAQWTLDMWSQPHSASMLAGRVPGSQGVPESCCHGY